MGEDTGLECFIDKYYTREEFTKLLGNLAPEHKSLTPDKLRQFAIAEAINDLVCRPYSAPLGSPEVKVPQEYIDLALKTYENFGCMYEAGTLASIAGMVEKAIEFYEKSEDYHLCAAIEEERGSFEKAVDYYEREARRAKRFGKKDSRDFWLCQALRLAEGSGLNDKAEKLHRLLNC